MSLYAQIDAAKKVLRVVVCDSPTWLAERLGGTWAETMQGDPVKQYAGIGYYDSGTVAPPQFIPPWVQPTHAENAYPVDAWVWHNGRAWLNLTAANTQQPGVSGWREKLTEWPEWVQPAGGHDAYRIGEKVTFNGKRYTSKIDANVWSPAGYPQGWQEQP